ncbi:MAG: hypothetical protein IIC50_16520 [Planctomycetes bacterium]|nr:hypothetical protein [Planctomycetota bacterium]
MNRLSGSVPIILASNNPSGASTEAPKSTPRDHRAQGGAAPPPTAPGAWRRRDARNQRARQSATIAARTMLGQAARTTARSDPVNS